MSVKGGRALICLKKVLRMPPCPGLNPRTPFLPLALVLALPLSDRRTSPFRCTLHAGHRHRMHTKGTCCSCLPMYPSSRSPVWPSSSTRPEKPVMCHRHAKTRKSTHTVGLSPLEGVGGGRQCARWLGCDPELMERPELRKGAGHYSPGPAGALVPRVS